MRTNALAGSSVVGASAGGAVVGAVLGEVGLLTRAAAVAPWLIAGATVAALYISWRRPHSTLGSTRQVRRGWPPWVPAFVAHSLWGTSLGLAVLTAIPYSSWLLVFMIEVVSGPGQGALLGALLGAVRQAVPMFLAANRRSGPGWMMDLLHPRISIRLNRINLLLVGAGGALLTWGSIS